MRGVITLGTVAVVAMALLLAYTVARVVPSVSEYFLIRSLVGKIALTAPPTDADARDVFERQRGVDGIESLQGSELNLSRAGGTVVIAFSYEKAVRLFGPVSLLIEYRGTSGGASP
jgi:hypothetical protein